MCVCVVAGRKQFGINSFHSYVCLGLFSPRIANDSGNYHTYGRIWYTCKWLMLCVGWIYALMLRLFMLSWPCLGRIYFVI